MTKKATVLIPEKDGRAHALAWKLAQSERVDRVLVVPGNPGTASIKKVFNKEDIDANDISALTTFAKQNAIDLTIVGSENLLAAGIVNHFLNRGFKIFGPKRTAAKIETSKVFSKNLMQQCGIPTAPYMVFKNYQDAARHVESKSMPLVVKADGLWAGKGVCVCQTPKEALMFLQKIMLNDQGRETGQQVVIEDCIAGQEISTHFLVSNGTVKAFLSSHDYKRLNDGDKGSNTGGMGAFAPVSSFDAILLEKTEREIATPIARAHFKKKMGVFNGCLYAGLMVSGSRITVLEFNARPGDPETQVYMRLLKTDLFELLWACVSGELSRQTIEWHPGFAVCVVLVSKGYPGSYETGFPINGIEEAEKQEGIVVFHAGTAYDQNQRLVTAGGRVLNVTATGPTLEIARQRVYKAVSKIHFNGMQFRTDIGAASL